jgi:calcium permeable stress-gated cation channel
VPNRERTKAPPPGLFGWVLSVFQTSNSEFIQKCGLDAYFFLRYLRMLLKIFVPLGFVILPILIPLNKIGGKDNNVVSNTNDTTWNITGLDQLAWSNIKPTHTDRYWAHLVLAVLSIIYISAVFFDELRGYIRLRQAYLTSPQHRLRASATTVLVTAIPKGWLTVEALTNLYDVFPGGIRNIWINRQLDELNEKVKLRDKLALALEAAETELITKCKKSQLKTAKAEAKKAGKKSKKENKKQKEATDDKAAELAMQSGISSGDPHQIAHNVHEALEMNRQSLNPEPHHQKRKFFIGGGINAISHGTSALGKTFAGGFRKVNEELDRTPGLADDEQISISSKEDAKKEKDFGQSSIRSSLDSDKDSSKGASQPQQQSSHEHGSGEQNSRRPGWRRKSSSISHLSRRSDKSPPEADEIPLTGVESTEQQVNQEHDNVDDGGVVRKSKDGERKSQEYPLAYNENYDDECGEPLWKKYIRQKDRETMRLPIFGIRWMPSLPLIGKKVDTIDYCRKEVARLNLEIEIDQQHPEKFPLMNSAFIQFNHQVAAHMACQAVSHHIPKQMAPRVVEISPDDVIWDNMSIKWWERYLRTGGIFIVVCGMVVGWAIPVAFTGVLSQLSYLEGKFSWLAWLSELPHWLFSAVQGVLPPLFLSLLMVVLPLILRFLSQTQGLQTGMSVELMVSNYYFAFLFVQLFIVVTISSSFSTLVDSVTDVTGWPELLADNIPKSSNYFFSYMILRAMSVSAGALAQIWNLIKWFILGPTFDKTARNKWSRTTNLHRMKWGSFFPVYTVLASIGR